MLPQGLSPHVPDKKSIMGHGAGPRLKKIASLLYEVAKVGYSKSRDGWKHFLFAMYIDCIFRSLVSKL